MRVAGRKPLSTHHLDGLLVHLKRRGDLGDGQELFALGHRE
jgi:hypothetical protein